MVRRLVLLLASLAACRPPTTPGATDSASTSATAGSEGSSGTTDACMRSGDCDSDGICVADYTPAPAGEPGGARGPAICGDEGVVCIDALDLTRWCFDHQGCCGDLRCRPADGVCEVPGLGVSTGTTEEPGASSSGGTGGSSTGGTEGSSGSSGGTTAGSTGSTG